MVIKIQIDSVLREMIFHLIYEAQKQRAEDKKYKNKNKIYPLYRSYNIKPSLCYRFFIPPGVASIGYVPYVF